MTTNPKTAIVRLAKAALVGIVFGGFVLLVFPEIRYAQAIRLEFLNTESSIPDRLSFNDAVIRAAPSVVNIYSVSTPSQPREQRSRGFERTSLGSGVIMSEDGYILTCYHVISKADSIFVATSDGQVLEAQIIGVDLFTDLAVLRVENNRLPPVPQLEDTKIKVGDLVMAIGNPFNLGQTVTSGLVSRTGRNGIANYVDFIQTDAVLNQGNSGGALVDSNGNLVGITNANFKTLDNRRQLQSVDGINFAVPYELAKRVMDEIITYGKVTRGQLGFSGNELIGTTGIVVTSVQPRGPAAKAGLRVNDVLLSVNDEVVTSAAKTLDLIAETEPGTTIVLEVSRDNKLITMPVVVGELDVRQFLSS